MATRKTPTPGDKPAPRKKPAAAETAAASAPAKQPKPADASPAYTVLARKYRPQTFADLIGQDAMVRTLQNAFETGRIAQAYMLTGVRGVGKTTTARILARALNYEGAQGDQGPSLEMPELGKHCVEIMESRHIDVLEMDAASNTGIDDVREIIESARYRPVQARYKVYIIDEVHMLSKAAFNGLLKTLEEPPEHVKFIFATTEVHKVPVTVVSRCQRFDLRRIEVEELQAHFKKIAELEDQEIAADAITLIARAAEGSVRDGLSLLDQAIAHASGPVSAQDVRAMLGLAERTRIFDLLEQTLAGEAAAGLTGLAALYQDGAEPAQIIADLADAVHVVTRIKAVGVKLADPTLSEAERSGAEALSSRLGMAQLARAWQMLLKGQAEVQMAPRPMTAAEMVLVRLAYAADLPTPAELAQSKTPRDDRPSREAGSGEPEKTPQYAAQGGALAPAIAEPAEQARPEAETEDARDIRPEPTSLSDVVALAHQRRDLKLINALEEQVRLVRFVAGHIELRLLEDAPTGLANDLGAKLTEWTGTRWIVAVSDEEGEETLRDQADRDKARELKEIMAHPSVKAVFEHFPDAEITDVRPAASDRQDDDAQD
jgi:DNA polymerase-3 subunit gamma/tau